MEGGRVAQVEVKAGMMKEVVVVGGRTWSLVQDDRLGMSPVHETKVTYSMVTAGELPCRWQRSRHFEDGLRVKANR